MLAHWLKTSKQSSGGGGTPPVVDIYEVDGFTPELVVDFPNNYFRKSTENVGPTLNSDGEYYTHNILSHTEELTDIIFKTIDFTVVALASTAPTGTNRAYLGYPTGSSGLIFVQDGNAIGNRINVFVKSAGFNWCALGTNVNDASRAYFNLSTGTIGAVGSNLTDAAISSIGDGWYLCSVTVTVLSGEAPFALWAVDSDAPFSVTPSGTSGIYMWGPHVYKTDNPMADTKYPLCVGGEKYIPTHDNARYGNTVEDCTFDELFSYTCTQPLMMIDSSGNLVWSPHNYVRYPTSWTNVSSGVIFTTGQPDPDGGTDAVKWDCDSSNQGNTLDVPSGMVDGAQYTARVKIKPIATGRDWMRITCASKTHYFRPSTYSGGAFVDGASDGGTFTATDIGDGWYQLEYTVTKDAGTSGQFGLYQTLLNDYGVEDDEAEFLMYQFHGFRSDFPVANNPDTGTSYTPTTTSQVLLPRIGHHTWNGSAWVNQGVLIEKRGVTNLFTNSTLLSTQDVAVTAQAYSVSFIGSGTITFSGAYTGSLVGTGTGEENRVYILFTPTAGTLTCTVSGTVEDAQIEASPMPTSYVPTYASTETRVDETLIITDDNFTFNRMRDSFYLDGGITYANDGTSKPVWSLYKDLNEYQNLYMTTDGTATETGMIRHSLRMADSNGRDTGVMTEFSPGIAVPIEIAVSNDWETSTHDLYVMSETANHSFGFNFIQQNITLASGYDINFGYYPRSDVDTAQVCVGQFRMWNGLTLDRDQLIEAVS